MSSGPEELERRREEVLRNAREYSPGRGAPPPLPAATVLRIAELWCDGLSVREIARRMAEEGAEPAPPWGTVARVLRRLGAAHPPQ